LQLYPPLLRHPPDFFQVKEHTWEQWGDRRAVVTWSQRKAEIRCL
jgi:hypothetical protein